MKNASYYVKKLIILVVILALPGFLYYLLVQKGKNRYKPLPIYGPKQVAKTGHKHHGEFIPDTIYHHLPDFKLTDQNGKTITPHNYDYKIFVANFFYTNCPELCTKVAHNLDTLVKGYAHNKMVNFISISLDPSHDSPQVLKQYASKLPNTDKWLFLTGDTATVNNLASKGFLLNALHTPDNQFILDDKLVLIDAERRIRGYYSGTSIAEVNRLNDEIKVLIAEELRKIKAPSI
ncbi:SCO family protein [Mucilaginibacter sp. RS28]|uniref:SCO family protein n=1 Tax=Mucilaginibacter straminoryzae TaxID=2932774 RepID=A0A9X1XBC8_9SPHI|nr:SCO family protein [Mucilaginibacter straminoryzae]MCJ8211609.1 SCO family protein [Mucilaginibacter straminoryzae]